MSEDLNRALTSVAKGAGIIIVGLITGNILGMVNQILLGRFLGPDQYGIFNLSMSLVMVASTLSVFGFFGSLSRFIPFHLRTNEQEKVRSVIDFSSLFVLSNGIVFAVALFLLAERISIGIFNEPELEIPLKIFGVGIPIFGFLQVLRGIVRGFKEARLEALIFNIGERIFKIVFFFVSMLFIYRLYGAITSFIAGAGASCVISIWLIIKKIYPEYRRSAKVNVAREILSFSWPLALTGFTFLFVTKTAQILLGYFLTKHEVGIYSPALVIAGMLLFVGTAFKYLFLPTVSEHFSRKDINALGLLYKSTSKWNFLVILPLVLLILLFATEIIRLLYGSEYTPGSTALIILSFGIGMNDFSGTSGNILVGSGHTKLNLLCEAIAAIMNILLNILLIPRYGITGAAVATGISYTARNISAVSLVYFKFGIHPYKASYLRLLLAGLITTGAIFGLKTILPFSWPINMILLGFVFILIYSSLAVLFRSLDRNDEIIIEAIESKTNLDLSLIKRFI